MQRLDSPIMRRQLPKAIPMYRMPTRHFMRRTSRAKEILLTDRAVASVLARLAVVIVIKVLVNAHATFVTVLKVVRATNPTKSTVRTVIGSFFVGHPEVANVAMVGTEACAAADALITGGEG
jgi:hypothetical protein